MAGRIQFGSFGVADVPYRGFIGFPGGASELNYLVGEHHCDILTTQGQYIGSLYGGRCWFNEFQSMDCSIFHVADNRQFRSIVTMDIKYHGLFLSLLGCAETRGVLITEQVDCTLQDFFQNYTPGRELFDDLGFPKSEVSAIIRNLILSCKWLSDNEIYHGDLTANKIFLVNGNVKFLMVNSESHDENSWNNNKDTDKKCIHSILKNKLRQSNALLDCERKDFLKETDILLPRVYYHPFLLTPEEREYMPVKLIPLKDAMPHQRMPWTTKIQGVDQVILDHRAKKRMEHNSEFPKDYSDTVKSALAFLRNRCIHLHDKDVKDDYKKLVNNLDAEIPDIRERNANIIGAMGPTYLVELYDWCKEKNADYLLY